MALSLYPPPQRSENLGWRRGAHGKSQAIVPHLLPVGCSLVTRASHRHLERGEPLPRLPCTWQPDAQVDPLRVEEVFSPSRAEVLLLPGAT